jgi:hypothetical protein
MLPIEIADFGVEIRFTDDGRISVYDGITLATGQKNPYSTWKRLSETHPDVLAKCENVQFPDSRGRLNRPTPVADLQVFLEILVILPGRLPSRIRKEAVQTLIRRMNGDLSLVDEILERARASYETTPTTEDAIISEVEGLYTEPEYFGTISNPLIGIPTVVRSGYGWKGNEFLMESWLTRLASHRGMYIHRQAPSRSLYSDSKTKSRRIDLILIPFFDDDSDVLSVYEFKSTYVDDYDVKDTFYSKNYIDIVIRDFRAKGFDFRKIRGRLVAPGGITESGVKELCTIEGLLENKYKSEGFEIELDAIPLHHMVWHEMYPAISKKYEDEEGRYGYGFVSNSVQSLCRMLTDPKPWIAHHQSIKKQLLELRKKEFLASSEDRQLELSLECEEAASSMLEVLIESNFGDYL